MEKISIFNYEAYYLDYLEGNLNEEDTLMLMNFLEAHPDLVVDEELPSLETPAGGLKDSLKKGLYQTDEDDRIGLTNFEHFIIAEKENVLTEDKKRELNTFLIAEGLEQERKLYGLTYFEADTSLQYRQKDGLRKARTIVLWPYYAAASVVLFFLLFAVWNSDQTTAGNYVAKGGSEGTSGTKKEVPANPSIPVDKSQNEPRFAVNNSGTQDNASSLRKVEEKEDKKPAHHVELPSRQLIAFSNPDKEISPLSPRLSVGPKTTPENESQQDLAYLGFNDLNNPIEPITKILSDRTKTDIDFRSGKSKVNSSKGFYLRIGKFEVSRRKH